MSLWSTLSVTHRHVWHHSRVGQNVLHDNASFQHGPWTRVLGSHHPCSQPVNTGDVNRASRTAPESQKRDDGPSSSGMFVITINVCDVCEVTECRRVTHYSTSFNQPPAALKRGSVSTLSQTAYYWTSSRARARAQLYLHCTPNVASITELYLF